jgi:hypothetical protein
LVQKGKSSRLDSLKRQFSDETLNDASVDEKLGQINRLSSKLVSRDMMAMYTDARQAMMNSITDTGERLPNYDLDV